jgi:hypothetical protein
MIIIYEPASKAVLRHDQITQDAIDANFIAAGENYDPVIYHPTEDKAALYVRITEAIYYQEMPIKALDFSIFFSAQELAKALPELPADWISESLNQ